MEYLIATDEPLPTKVAKALSDYIAKNGPPPPCRESIEIDVDGVVIEVRLFSVKETE